MMRLKLGKFGWLKLGARLRSVQGYVSVLTTAKS